MSHELEKREAIEPKYRRCELELKNGYTVCYCNYGQTGICIGCGDNLFKENP